MVRVYLFSSLRFVVDGASLEVRSGLTRTLLAYLIVSRNRPLDRDALSRLLWPDAEPSSARRNLREYLYRVRNLLERLWPDAEPLTTDDNLVRFDPPAGAWIDVIHFERALARDAVDDDPDVARQALERAVALYSGDLLSEYYDDWALAARASLRQQYLEALAALSRQREAAGDLAGALQTARQLVAEEPLREDAQRRVMRLYDRAGDRARALAQYRHFREMLEAELGAAPLPETDALYRQIRDGTAPASQSPSAAAAAAAAPPEAAPLPFVERQEEMKALDAACVRGGATPMLLVAGPAGSGKTRLVEEWLARNAEEDLVIRGRGYEFERHIAYRPVLDALQQALPRIPWELLPPDRDHVWLAPLARLLPDLYFHLPHLAERPADGSPAQPHGVGHGVGHAVDESMAQLLLSAARRRPVVLFIDDLQWADAGTWRFLHFLRRRTGGAPLLISATVDPSRCTDEQQRQLRQWQKLAGATVVELQPPTAAAIAHLLARTLDRSPEQVAAFARRLRALSGGNFRYVAEAIRALQQMPAGALEQDPWPLPEPLRLLIQTRLDRLGVEAARRLGVAAALGRSFSLELLQAVTDEEEEELLNELEGWLSQGVIEERHGRYDFTHPALREAAYERLTIPRRRRIHQRIGEALAQLAPEEWERIAGHYQRGHRPVAAIPALLQAAQHARDRGDADTARQFGRRALELARELDDRQGMDGARRLLDQLKK